MRTKCGVAYEAGMERPADARFALWYFGHVRFFSTKEEADKAFGELSPSEKDDATVKELES
jgi:hypothetical protein